MTYRWRITIEVFPYSVKYAEKDQEAAGDRVRYFYVDAPDIDQACKMAHCFAEGIKSNPAVWQTPIMGIHVFNDDDRKN